MSMTSSVRGQSMNWKVVLIDDRFSTSNVRSNLIHEKDGSVTRKNKI